MRDTYPKVSYTFEIDNDDFSRAGEASIKIKKILKQAGIEEAIIRKASVAAYEAEMNIVIHSNGGSISLSIYPNYIEIIAEDRGPGIEDIGLAMKEGYSTASEHMREKGFGTGMGLPNIKKHSDYLNIETKVGGFTRVTSKILV